MKIKAGLSFAILLTLVLTTQAVAQEQRRSIQAILSEIKQEQNVQRVEQIDPDRVSDATLEELGDAVMDVMFPNERQHEYMDDMMGGEGSRSLEAMHRSMGYSYLASGGERGWGMMGVSGSRWNMMGPWMMGGSRGFGWSGRFLSAGLGVWILVALLGAAVVVLALILATRRNQPRAD